MLLKLLVFLMVLKGSGCRCRTWSRLRYIGIAWGWTRLTSDAPLLWNGHRWMSWGWRSDVFCLIRALHKYSGHFDVFFTQLGYSIRPGAKTDSTYLGFSLTVFFFTGMTGLCLCAEAPQDKFNWTIVGLHYRVGESSTESAYLSHFLPSVSPFPLYLIRSRKKQLWELH